ncbi:hypothetical protein [Prochlorococcus sp. MIT 1303]|uniref:hypothetical protein n=1 Tax=Prochlorococcus sp. MIT 1303 TaxID=1723647 RepID=UPI001E5EDC84|nr:hypothetical protein [Prochlorococcus sp. MIT 1303]
MNLFQNGEGVRRSAYKSPFKDWVLFDHLVGWIGRIALLRLIRQPANYDPAGLDLGYTFFHKSRCLPMYAEVF